MNILTPKQYQEFYNKDICKKQNEQIKREIAFLKEKQVVDIGCGNGLGYELLNSKQYIGIDIDKERIEYAKEKHGNLFLCIDIEVYLKHENISNLLSLFSINYIKCSILEHILKNTNSVYCVFYNKPYLKGSGSIYELKEEYFKQLHPQSELYLDIFKKYSCKTYKLQQEEYYYVAKRD